MTLLAETTEGMHNLFRLSTRRLERGLLQAAAHGPRAARPSTARASSRTTGCPSGEVQTRPALGNYDAARQAAADYQDIFGRDNYFLELMDHGLDDREAGPRRPAPAGQGPADPAASPPTTPTTSCGRTPPARSTCSASTPARRWTSRPATPASGSRFDGDGYYLKSAAEMRELWRELPEACDNTLLIAERCDVEFTEGNGTYMPRFPCPEGETEESWFVKEVERGLARRYPDGITAEVRDRAELRDRRHPPDGLPGLLPRRRRLHQLGQGARHPRRPGPRLRRRLDRRLRHAHHRPRPARARPAVRAVPQPRARLDARLRHRLRRASARRGDPLRHREVRRRPGRR